MHNLTKIRIFRSLLRLTYPLSLILILPFALLKKKKKSKLFFFLDRFAIGGAQRVYLDILESVADVDKTIYFTRKSPDDKLRSQFFNYSSTECHDIHIVCDNLLLRLFSVHFFAFYINRHRQARVLSSNSTFFYDMLPFLKKEILKIELLHNFAHDKNGMEFFGLANYKYLDKRFVIDDVTRANIEEQYIQYGVPSVFKDRIVVSEYGVDVPEKAEKSAVPPLKILYAGRGSRQKRVWLLNKIAEHFIDNRLPVHFTFVGPLKNELSNVVLANCLVLGEVGDQAVMHQLFDENHAVILTSAFEGFPVVVKEGMAHGCVPIVTAVPGNKVHLRHGINAMLIEDVDDEEKVISNGIAQISLLLSDTDLLQKIAKNAYSYAQKKFGKQDFLATYRKLLLE